MLRQWLRKHRADRGHDHEPGTRRCWKARISLDPAEQQAFDRTTAELLLVGRAKVVERVIIPALERGEIVPVRPTSMTLRPPMGAMAGAGPQQSGL